MRRLAAVTGGTGFLGRAVVAALLRRGWRVRLLVRRQRGQLAAPEHELELVFGDLDDADALRRLMRGADAVVHAAGLVKARGRSDFMAVNAAGSGKVAAALAAAAPAARLVHVSTMAAREPHLSDYAASKRAGEVEAVSACGGAPWVIVRPPAVYGPWDSETLRVFRAARGPVVPIFHGPDSRVCLIHVDDAAEAVAALCAGGPSGRTFEVTDARREGYPWRTVAEEAIRAVGGTARLVTVPRPLIQAAGSALGAIGRLLGASPFLTSGKAREILHPDWSSAADRQPPAGLWEPRVPLPQGFAETVRWYRDAQWL
ncbi:NAD-dependent epimerase/dehydratase family protein [Arenibaculum pallidiluteum]|uniref:NAD-dependent epimerase/dehydratase family protein n=1 Tax=Arenibaculum pallidiluteum TaxID=2812559 RepID=UPI001A96DB63|nr:SDR family NAD(P)-dependent oxidoreductase [Arenibaculum pallidiluteum]